LIFAALPFVFVVPHLFKQIAIVLWGLNFTLDQSSQTIRKNEKIVARFEDVERLHVRQRTLNETANYDLVLILRNGRRFSLATSSNQNEIYDAAEEVADLLHITDEIDHPGATAQAQRFPPWLPYIFVAVGVFILTGGAVTYLNTRAFIENAYSAPGTVIDLIERRDSEGSVTYAPKVRFREPIENRDIEFVSSMSSSPPAYRRGERVSVLYELENPENAKIQGLFDLWGVSIIVAFVGLMFFIGGLLFVRFQRAGFNRHIGSMIIDEVCGAADMKQVNVSPPI